MKKIISLALVTLVFASCGVDKIKDPAPDGNKGKLTLGSLTRDGSLLTRGDNSNTDEFIITLKNSLGETVNTYTYAEVKNEVLELSVGEYKLEAVSPDRLPVAFDQPIYSGNQNIVIEASKITNASIMCSISNMKVTVVFEESFKQDLKDYEVIVASDDGFLIFDKDNEGRAGFFDVKQLSVKVKAKRVSDNVAIEQSFQITEVEAKRHHIIELSTKPKGTAGLEIDIDYTLNDKPIQIEIDDDEGVVDPVDPSDAISITGPGIGEPLTLTDATAPGASVDIVVSAPKGIAQLHVQLDSQSLNDELLGNVGLAREFDIANLEQYSESYPDMQERLTELGIISAGDPVKGKTSYTVRIGAFMSLLPAGEGGTPLEHRFPVKVVDGEGNTKSTTLTVIRVGE